MTATQVIGFPAYHISDCGEVYSYYTHKQLKPQLHNGYRSITLCKNKCKYQLLVHRLVLIHFDRLPAINEVANHRDGDKLNNSIGNLEWVTQSQNVKHAYKNGLRIIGEKHREKCAVLGRSKRKLSMDEACRVRRLFDTGFYTKTDLAFQFGISRKGIRQIINNETYKE